MIVKDEAEDLPQCLESVKHIVDEIIVVDTGSTDNTIAIAETYKARIIHCPWQDNFATARNQGLQEAISDWVLWLDADERLDLHKGEKLKDLLIRDSFTKHDIQGVQFILKNHLDGAVEQINVLRMVRNRPEYQFEGNIHEQIIPSVLRLHPNCSLGQIDIHIHHYGYMTQNMTRKQKVDRNFRMLLQAKEKEPDNPVYDFYLGIELYRRNQLVEALEHFDVSITKSFNLPDTMVAFAYKFKCLMLQLLDRHKELVHCSEEGIAKFKQFTDLYHFKAHGLYALGLTCEAIDVLRRALQIGPAPTHFPSTEGFGSYRTYYELGTFHEALGEYKLAIQYYSQAQRLRPNFLPTH